MGSDGSRFTVREGTATPGGAYLSFDIIFGVNLGSRVYLFFIMHLSKDLLWHQLDCLNNFSVSVSEF